MSELLGGSFRFRDVLSHWYRFTPSHRRTQWKVFFVVMSTKPRVPRYIQGRIPRAETRSSWLFCIVFVYIREYTDPKSAKVCSRYGTSSILERPSEDNWVRPAFPCRLSRAGFVGSRTHGTHQRARFVAQRDSLTNTS